VEDVRKALALFVPVEYGLTLELSKRFSVRLVDAGHILGSAMVEVRVADGVRERKVLVSGDIGRYDMPLHRDPDPPPGCDVLLLESTYGGRRHGPQKPEEELLRVARLAVASKGILVIPAFAVGRSQQILFILHRLIESGSLPRVPVVLDSPMGVDATRLYGRYAGRYRLDPGTLRQGVGAFYEKGVRMVRSQEQSRGLDKLRGPAVLISSSGMITGGRILHHLMRLLPDPANVVALAGFQAAGTRGRYLAEGAKALRILREEVQVAARVEDLKGFSGHADEDELMRWTAPLAPKRCWLVHGEPQAAQALAVRLRSERGWTVEAAAPGRTVEI